MPTFTQENRTLAVHTPLGDDVLLLTGFTGQEEISRLFSFRLDFLSEKEDIPAKDIVGSQINFRVKLADGSPRFFNGFVSRFSAGSANLGFRNYRADVVPWLWFLTRTADCRIFQNMTIPEIIEKIFADLNFKDYDASQITGAHPKWKYCVQYRETDFNFVSRIMEEEGIFYFFRHEEKKHTLVLADHAGAYKDCPEHEVEHEYSFGARFVTDRITSWEHRYEFRPGKWSQTDYYFETPAGTNKTPSSILMNSANSLVKLPGNEKFEIYDYPGGYARKEDGVPDTTTRMQEEEVPFHVVHAASTCKTFTPGGKFKLTRHSAAWEVGKGYVITSLRHAATEPATYTGGGAVVSDYSNAFACIPDSVPFRPGRITPKPVIQGEQTAVVVGPKSEEIWPDKYGRIKVQFYWDREGKSDENSSCWMRCMQTSAGKGWGSMFIPRIGQEVIVSFLEGDPNRPVVIGEVYNADQMPHYELPAEKTKSYIKTCSSLGGEGFNELRFEDKKDKEQIFVHAQRNMDVRTLNDSLERTLINRHQIIGWEKDGKKGGDQREMVYQDKRLDVKRNHIEHIEGNMTLLIGKGSADDGGNWDIVVEKTKKELIEANDHVHVKGGRSEQIGDQSLTVGGDLQEKVGKVSTIETGQEIHVKAGTKLIVEATTQLTVKVGGSFIDINPSGVVIQGTTVFINSGQGPPPVAGPASPAGAQDAKQAKPTKPDLADNAKPGLKSSPAILPTTPPPNTKPGPAPKPPPPTPKKEEPPKKLHFVKFQVLDDATGQPMSGVLLKLKLPNGTEGQYSTDSNGMITFDPVDPGTCDIQKMIDSDALEVVQVQ
jgi:type VI secretion system secreted protein VgrG